MLAFALKAAISGVLLYFAFAHVNFNLVGQELDHLKYSWLTAAVLLLLAQISLGALRWQLIVQNCESTDTPPFTLTGALRINFIAAFFNQTLPSTIGGDAIRIWLLGRAQGGWRAAAYSVLIDRMVGVLVLALMVIVCLPWSFALISNVAGRIALLAVGFGSTGACLTFVALGFLRGGILDRWWMTRHLTGAGAAARGVLLARSSGSLILTYSVFNHLITATAAWCLAQSIAAPLEWSQALLLVLPVLLIASVPISIAGWGTREAAMVLAFGYAGLPESDGLIVSVLLGIASFAAGLVGGLFWILDRGIRRPQAPR
ncbi:MAG: lysylphosphatidylglycerol synthase transmembrane domain-containing protein [Pseudolabrys sp.]